MESGPQLEEGPQAAIDLEAAFGGRGHPADDLEEGALAGPVGAHHPQGRPARQLEADILERHMLLGVPDLHATAGKPIRRCAGRMVPR